MECDRDDDDKDDDNGDDNGDGWSEWEDYGDPRKKHKSAQFSDDAWNVFGTLQVGYDHLFHNRFLIGAFADFDFYGDSDHSFSSPWITYYDDKKKEVGSIDGNIELEHIWSVGGRLGFLVSPRLLIYGAGGYSEANLDGAVDVTFKSRYGRDTVLSLAVPDDLQGYFVGGGAEVKLHRNVSLKFEYRYTDLDGGKASDSLTKYSNSYCRDYSYGKCTKEKRFVKDFMARSSFDADIHSVRAALVLSLTPEERPVVPLK